MEAKKLIREIRLSLGLTQKQAGEMTGYNKQKVADYEHGRARTPGDYLLRLQAIQESARHEVQEAA